MIIWKGNPTPEQKKSAVEGLINFCIANDIPILPESWDYLILPKDCEDHEEPYEAGEEQEEQP